VEIGNWDGVAQEFYVSTYVKFDAFSAFNCFHEDTNNAALHDCV